MAAKSTRLRAVKPGEPGEKAPVKRRQSSSVAEAAASGDVRATLIAMRDRVARALDSPDCPPRELAALTKRLDDIMEKLKTLGLEDEAEVEELGAAVDDDRFDAEAL